MSGFFGGGSTTVNNELDPAARAILEQIIGDTNALKAQNPAFVAPLDTAAIAGLQGLQDRPQSGFIGDAASQLESTLQGGFFGQNPGTTGFNQGLQGVRDAITDQATRGVGDAFSLAGRTGSPAQGLSLGKTIANALAPFEFNAFENQSNRQFQGFENERQRQLSSLGFAPTVEGLQDARSLRLLGVGDAVQAQNQRTLEEPLRSFEFFLNPLLAAAGNFPVDSIQKDKASGSQIAAGIGGVLGGLPSLIGGLFCDERIKENIEPIGTIAGVNIYTFNYMPEMGIGTETRIGPLAQDVELAHPDAVFEVNGIKAVDMEILFGGLNNE